MPSRSGRSGAEDDRPGLRVEAVIGHKGLSGGAAAAPAGARQAAGRAVLRLGRRAARAPGPAAEQQADPGAGLCARTQGAVDGVPGRRGRADGHEPPGAGVAADPAGPQELAVLLDGGRRQACRHRAKPDHDMRLHGIEPSRTSSMSCSAWASIRPAAWPNSRHGCGSSTSPSSRCARTCTGSADRQERRLVTAYGTGTFRSEPRCCARRPAGKKHWPWCSRRRTAATGFWPTWPGDWTRTTRHSGSSC